MKTALSLITLLLSLQIVFSQEKIYVSTYNPTKLFIYDPITTELNEIPQDTAIINSPTFFVIDTIHQRFFQSYRRTNLDTFVITSSNLDGSDRVIIKLDSNYTVDLAIDYEDNKLIWLDNTSDKIMRSNLDGSSVEIVLDSLNIHSGLVYNHENNKIYWVEYLTNNTIIHSVDKNGMNKQEVISGSLGAVGRLAIDYETDKLYWTADEKRKIQRSNYDGSMIENIHTFTGQERPFSIYIDKRKNKLYWTDYGLDKVFRSDLNGNNKEEVISQLLGDPISIAPYYNIINSAKETSLSHNLSLSPNPANDFIYLKFKQLNISVLPSIISIYSLDGKLIQSLHQNHLEVPIHHLQSGFYILKVQFSDGSVSVGKFIKS